MNLIVLAVVLVTLVVVTMWLLERLIRDPELAMALAGIGILLDIALRGDAGVSVGGTRIAVLDVVFGALLVAAVARHLRLRRPMWRALLYILVGLLLLSFVRGYGQFGPKAANDFRSYLTFAGGLLYFASVPYNERYRDALGRTIALTAGAATAVVVLRWGAAATGVNLGPLAAEFDHTIRVLSGTESYLYAEALLVTAATWGTWERFAYQHRLAALFAALSLLLNRRTMWAALVVALGIMALRDREWAKRLTAVFLVAGVVTIGAAWVLPDQALEGDEALAADATSTGTLEWRIEGWTDLLTQPRDPVDWVFGEPFGSGYERRTFSRTVGTNPHNYYVQNVLRVGGLGLAAFLALYGGAIVGLIRREDDGVLLGPTTLLAILCGHLIWYVAWPNGALNGVLLGLAVSAVAGQPRRRSARRPPVRATRRRPAQTLEPVGAVSHGGSAS